MDYPKRKGKRINEKRLKIDYPKLNNLKIQTNWKKTSEKI